MLRTGVMATCDRCGKKEWFPATQYTSFEMSGWEEIDKRNLCPECVDEYEEMKETFFRGPITEEEAE